MRCAALLTARANSSEPRPLGATGARRRDGEIEGAAGRRPAAARYLALSLLRARRRPVVTTNAPVRPTTPRPRIARPSTTPAPSPPDCPSAVASAAEIGDAADDLTPLHRSPVALRVAGAVAAAVGPLLRDADVRALAGALDRADAVCVAVAVVLAGAALLEPVDGAGARVGAAARGAEDVDGREPAGVRVVAPADPLRVATDPLVDAEAEPEAPEALAVDGAGAAPPADVPGAGVAAAGGPVGGFVGATPGDTLAGGGATAGGGTSVGDAGVPNPDGVQAHARPAPVTAIPSNDSNARLNIRARERTGPTLPVLRWTHL